MHELNVDKSTGYVCKNTCIGLFIQYTLIFWLVCQQYISIFHMCACSTFGYQKKNTLIYMRKAPLRGVCIYKYICIVSFGLKLSTHSDFCFWFIAVSDVFVYTYIHLCTSYVHMTFDGSILEKMQVLSNSCFKFEKELQLHIQLFRLVVTPTHSSITTNYSFSRS